MSTPASVISLTGRAGFRGDLRAMSSQQIRAARERLRLGRGDFAAYLSERVGWGVTAGAVAKWEQGSVPPGDVLLAAGGQVPEADLLDGVPGTIDAGLLAGAWVTSYRFSSPPKCHADIARLEVSGRQVRASNYPPEPRTEGHSAPFRNEIRAKLVNRHLIGSWKNSSDERYLGGLHLAVMPGERVMEGYFTNFVDDVHVGAGSWKWVRVDPASIEGNDLAAMTLRDPAELCALLEAHSQYDAPLSLSDLGEVA